MKSILRRAWFLLLLLIAALTAGTFVHEVIGHGLTTIVLGGRVTRVVILGVQFHPSLEFVDWPIVHGYGFIETDGLGEGPRANLALLAGSMSTWFVAVLANALLWTRRRWTGWPRAVLIVLGLFWIDLLTYTLPSWGLRRSVLWGQNSISEPFEAAVALGLGGDAFRAFVLLTCGAMSMSLLLHTIRARIHRPEGSTG